jgi:hypothetical protein
VDGTITGNLREGPGGIGEPRFGNSRRARSTARIRCRCRAFAGINPLTILGDSQEVLLSGQVVGFAELCWQHRRARQADILTNEIVVDLGIGCEVPPARIMSDPSTIGMIAKQVKDLVIEHTGRLGDRPVHDNRRIVEETPSGIDGDGAEAGTRDPWHNPKRSAKVRVAEGEREGGG